MKVYILTDMEGVAGVLSFEDYEGPGSRYYEVGRDLATLEASAAVQGSLDAGASEVYVLDGHGAGAMVPTALHASAKLIAGRPLRYPFGLDSSFDAIMLVGHHAKAGTLNGHLWHTMDRQQIDFTLNGVSVGEVGINIALAGWFAVPCVLVTGDRACCEEAQALVPGLETAAVKEGLNRGAAIHLHPDRARELIREGARQGLERLSEIPPWCPEPPFRLVSTRPGALPGTVDRRVVQSKDLVDALSRTWG